LGAFATGDCEVKADVLAQPSRTESKKPPIYRLTFIITRQINAMAVAGLALTPCSR